MCRFKVQYIRPISSLKPGIQVLDNHLLIRVLRFIKKYRLSIIHDQSLCPTPHQKINTSFLAPGFSFMFSNSISFKSKSNVYYKNCLVCGLCFQSYCNHLLYLCLGQGFSNFSFVIGLLRKLLLLTFKSLSNCQNKKLASPQSHEKKHDTTKGNNEQKYFCFILFMYKALNAVLDIFNI